MSDVEEYSATAVVEHQTDTVEQDMEATVPDQPKFTVTLPEEGDIDNLVTLSKMLETKQDVHGVKTMLKRLAQYQYHKVLLDTAWAKLGLSADVINGNRTYAQKNGMKERSAKSTAERFYNSLSTPALRQYATTMGIDYDSFDSVDTVVDELVKKHLAMTSM